MVTVVPPDPSWGKAFRNIGEGIGEGYIQRADEAALRKAVEELGDNASPRDILNVLTNTRTYSPESKQTMLKNYLGVSQYEELQKKQQAQLGKEQRHLDTERANVEKIVNQLDYPEEQKQQLGKSLTQDAAEGLLKEQVMQKNRLSLSNTKEARKQAEKDAEKYIDITKEVAGLEDMMGNIGRAKQISDELGLSGTLINKVLSTELGTELEGIGFALTEPIVKIFNPSGPIAQQKLKMIQDKYAIKASDPPWVRKGKIAALDRFAKQALARANGHLELINSNGGRTESPELRAYDKETEAMGDAMLDYDIAGSAEPADLDLDAKKYKNRTITSPQGQKYYSDGTKWVKR